MPRTSIRNTTVKALGPIVHCRSFWQYYGSGSCAAVMGKRAYFRVMTNTFGARSTLKVGSRAFEIFRLDALTRGGSDIRRLPYSLRILLEDLLRTEDGVSVIRDDIEALARWSPTEPP